jgi:hypothetical protein
MIEPDQDPKYFTSFEKQEMAKLEKARKLQGLPDNYSPVGVEIRRDKLSHQVFFFNAEKKMCMLQGDRLEIYYQCPTCHQEGFKDTISHSPRCDEQSFGNMGAT